MRAKQWLELGDGGQPSAFKPQLEALTAIRDLVGESLGATTNEIDKPTIYAQHRLFTKVSL